MRTQLSLICHNFARYISLYFNLELREHNSMSCSTKPNRIPFPSKGKYNGFSTHQFESDPVMLRHPKVCILL